MSLPTVPWLFPLSAFTAYKRSTSGKRNPFEQQGIVKSSDRTSQAPIFKSAVKMPVRGAKRGRMAPLRRPSSKRARMSSKKRSVRPKRTIRKSTKSKKRKVSKGPSLTVGTARMRKVDHEVFSSPVGAAGGSPVYIPFNSIGSKAEMIKMVAQALILHYMHRVGDYRANATMVPTGTSIFTTNTSGQTTTWSRMVFHSISQTSGVEDKEEFIVWSDTDGTTPGMQSLDAMTLRLGNELVLLARRGRRLSQVSVFREDFTGVTTKNYQCILMDITAGRNVVEFTSKAALKLQNTTPADATHTGAETCGHDNALNINRNPLDGVVYNFKNAVPKFKIQYLIAKTDASRDHLDGITDCYTAAPGGVSVPQFALHGNEWLAPPVTPSTIFSNFSGKSATGIEPGGHKSYYLNESYKGAVNSFLDRYFPTTPGGNFQDAYVVPPGGVCMMVCLKPKYRNLTQAAVNVQAEIDHMYVARVTRAKLTPLPMSTFLA